MQLHALINISPPPHPHNPTLIFATPFPHEKEAYIDDLAPTPSSHHGLNINSDAFWISQVESKMK